MTTAHIIFATKLAALSIVLVVVLFVPLARWVRGGRNKL